VVLVSRSIRCRHTARPHRLPADWQVVLDRDRDARQRQLLAVSPLVDLVGFLEGSFRPDTDKRAQLGVELADPVQMLGDYFPCPGISRPYGRGDLDRSPPYPCSHSSSSSHAGGRRACHRGRRPERVHAPA
jgi:hypothetical protein